MHLMLAFTRQVLRMNMKLKIRKAEGSDLEALERQIHLPMPDQHSDQLRQQDDGIVTYLVAWSELRAIAYGLIHWKGPRDSVVANKLAGCPEIFNLTVVEEFRGQGIGTQMMESLEQCVRDRHLSQVGLGVAIENDRALRLYRRLGYHKAGVPGYIDRWAWIDSAGTSHAEADPCIFLIKEL